jgi:hypothetical protein
MIHRAIKMEFYKNKTSGMYFIFINFTSKDEALFVSPEFKIKVFSLNLFEETDENDECTLLSRGLITESQIQQYNVYKNDRNEEFIDELTSSQKIELLKKLKESLKSE